MSAIIHRLGSDTTPYERFRATHPHEADKLKAAIMKLTGTSDANAGFVMQEIMNTVWRVAKAKA